MVPQAGEAFAIFIPVMFQRVREIKDGLFENLVGDLVEGIMSRAAVGVRRGFLPELMKAGQ